MTIRLAVMGFRHFHILDLWRRARETAEIEIVGACEEDPATRDELAAGGVVEITHADYDEMLATVECDAIAIGDYFAKRGSLIFEALASGKHVISDKPICTSLGELDMIEELSRQNGLKVGCMLDQRDTSAFIGVRNLVRQGIIGDVQAIAFGGQHPLRLGTRPAWYFEPGKHGGTINDIAIHAIDVIPWITGVDFKTVVAARCWNAFVGDYPHFRDAAQMMLELENGCGVLGDVSYFMPDGVGYRSPLYWRTTFWGRQGVIETSSAADAITVALREESETRYEDLPDPNPGGYLRSFVRDIRGELDEDELCTEQVLRGARFALRVQAAADTMPGDHG